MKEFVPVIAAALGAALALLGAAFTQVNTARRERRSLLLDKYERLYACVGDLISWSKEQVDLASAIGLSRSSPAWALETINRKNAPYPGDQILRLARCYQPRLVPEAEKLVALAERVSGALQAVSDQDLERFNSQESVEAALVMTTGQRAKEMAAAADHFRRSVVSEVRRAL